MFNKNSFKLVLLLKDMVLDESREELVRYARQYIELNVSSKNFLTVKQIGLRELETLMDEGYRVIISPARTLGYESECGRGCECEFCKVGKGKNTVLPNRIGEIYEIDIPPPTAEWSPYISDMVWYTGGLGRGNISMWVGEEPRLEDLLVVCLIPPKKHRLKGDSKQLRFDFD